MIRPLLSAAALVICTSTTAHALSVGTAAVFGDSLSDPYEARFQLLPQYPRVYGRDQATNEDTWATMLGFDQDSGRNYAQTGANALEDFRNQIAEFASGGADAATAFVWFGGNDIAQALAAGGPAEAQARIGNGLGALAAGLQGLIGLGFSDLVVFTAPDIGDTPRVRALGAPAASAATALTGAWNAGVANILAGIPDGIGRRTIDIGGILGPLYADPASFGLTNITGACLTPIGPAPLFDICDDPSAYAYYDAFHPTDTVHRLIADEVRGATGLAPIPLPAGLPLLALGLAAVGVAGHRRKGSL